ncbi:ATP-grasp domain-containing protein [Maribacter aestuarii]|uniref:ATP-grasp domain-containing protein n=1 Tax=Maribacter aestuarii TaxID=1130723 RepID=UPI00248AB238|nr:ATP-grasp domain-containing protein [Maribacter aestuarii]
MNILFTCAGRRNYLINYFKEALNGKGNIIAADKQLTAPALVDADIARKVPSINSPDYIDALRKIILEEKVNAIISLNDLELPVLSKNKEKLELSGAKLIISNERIIDIAFDKWKTYNFFKLHKIATPKTYKSLDEALVGLNNSEINFPLIVKPRWGSASIGIDSVDSKEELILSYNLNIEKLKKGGPEKGNFNRPYESILVQEKIIGEEYGIDILNDFDGNYYDSFVRQKLVMRSGETDKAVSVIDEKFSRIAKKVSLHSGHIGNMDCDFFVKDEKVYFLEMNPRFGGGYPFSHQAGINTPGIYIDWLNGVKDVKRHNNYLPNLSFAKCDRLIKI